MAAIGEAKLPTMEGFPGQSGGEGLKHNSQPAETVTNQEHLRCDHPVQPRPDFGI